MIHSPRITATLASSALLGMAIEASAAGLVVSSLFDPALEDGRIEVLRTDGSDRQVVREIGSGLRAVAVDSTGTQLLWSDVNSDRIDQVNFANPVGRPTGIQTSGLQYPQAMKTSHTAGKIFWSDSIAGQVMSCDTDGANVQTLFASPSTLAIALDDTNQKLYWEKRETASRGAIMRSNFDGSGTELVVDDVPTATSIAVDPVNGQVYWTSSAGLADGNSGVYRVAVDGSGFEELFLMGENQDTNGIVVDPNNGFVYWGQGTGANRADIYRMGLDGSAAELISSGYGNISDMVLLDQFPDVPQLVDIDVVPLNDRNIIRLYSRGSVWVAVLSDVDSAFDPLQVDMSTVTFGPGEAPAVGQRVADVNRDGVGDLWLRFEVQETGLEEGDSSAGFVGQTFHGQKVMGMNPIVAQVR